MFIDKNWESAESKKKKQRFMHTKKLDTNCILLLDMNIIPHYKPKPDVRGKRAIISWCKNKKWKWGMACAETTNITKNTIEDIQNRLRFYGKINRLVVIIQSLYKWQGKLQVL